MMPACVGCRGAPPPLGRLAGISRVEVRVGPHFTHPGFALTDPRRLAAIATVLNRQEDGWHAGWATQPAGDLSVQFFRNDSLLGVLGVGPRFLAEAGKGPRLLKEISTETERQLRDLFDPRRPVR